MWRNRKSIDSARIYGSRYDRREDDDDGVTYEDGSVVWIESCCFGKQLV